MMKPPVSVHEATGAPSGGAAVAEGVGFAPLAGEQADVPAAASTTAAFLKSVRLLSR